MRGFRIEPGEIEAAPGEHPAVAGARGAGARGRARRQAAGGLRGRGRRGARARRGAGRGAHGEQVAEWRCSSTTPTAGADAHGRRPSTSPAGTAATRASPSRGRRCASGWSTRSRGSSRCGRGGCWRSAAARACCCCASPPRVRALPGTDFSRAVLAWLGTGSGGAGLPQVSCSRRAADDFAGIARRSFDTVILNSVVQYFPERRLPGRVLAERSTRGLPPAAHLRRRRAQPAAARGLPRLGPALPGRRRPARRRSCGSRSSKQHDAGDTSWCSTPGSSPPCAGALPRIGRVEIRPKRGPADNELTRFRYDVVLHVGERGGRRRSSLARLGAWRAEPRRRCGAGWTELRPTVLGVPRARRVCA